MTILAHVPPNGAAYWLRGVARGLVLTWALFWIWFNVMSGFGELRSSGVGGLIGHLGLAAVMLAVAVSAWRWDLPGGLALLALTAAMAWFFRGLAPPTALMLLLAPALAGLLLLLVAALPRGAR